MARRYAQTFTEIWEDPEFCALSEGAQRTYWMLSSQKDISAVGLLNITYGRWAGTCSTSTKDSIRENLLELHRARFVVVDEVTEELLVRTFTKWDEGYPNAKRRPVILRAGGEIRSLKLRKALAAEFAKLGLPTDTLRIPDDSAGEVLNDHTDSDTKTNGHKVDDDLYSQVDSPSDVTSDGRMRRTGLDTSDQNRSDGLAVTQGPCKRAPNQEPQTAALLGDDDPAIAAALATVTLTKSVETENQRCRRLTLRYTERVQPSNYNAIFKLVKASLHAFPEDEVIGGVDALADMPTVTVSANSLRIAILCAKNGEPFTWNGRASPNGSQHRPWTNPDDDSVYDKEF